MSAIIEKWLLRTYIHFGAAIRIVVVSNAHFLIDLVIQEVFCAYKYE